MRGNSIALAGNIYPKGRDDKHLELRFSAGGTAFISFNLSCWSHKDKDNDDKNVYVSYSCVAFGDLAEHIAESLEPGDSVLAFARIQANNWEDDDGNKRYDTQAIVDELGPTLRWGTVDVNRTERKSGGSGRSADSQPKARDSYAPDEAPF